MRLNDEFFSSAAALTHAGLYATLQSIANSLLPHQAYERRTRTVGLYRKQFYICLSPSYDQAAIDGIGLHPLRTAGTKAELWPVQKHVSQKRNLGARPRVRPENALPLPSSRRSPAANRQCPQYRIFKRSTTKRCERHSPDSLLPTMPVPSFHDPTGGMSNKSILRANAKRS